MIAVRVAAGVDPAASKPLSRRQADLAERVPVIAGPPECNPEIKGRIAFIYRSRLNHLVESAAEAAADG